MGGGIVKEQKPMELNQVIEKNRNNKKNMSLDLESFLVRSNKINKYIENIQSRKVNNHLANLIRSTTKINFNEPLNSPTVSINSIQTELIDLDYDISNDFTHLSTKSSDNILEIVDESGNIKLFNFYTTIYH